MQRRRVVPGIIVGGASLTLVGAIAALIASTPGEEATDSEKIDYLIEASNTQTGIISALAQQITDLNGTLKDIREINGLDFAFDPMRYITWKLRSGEALPNIFSYYQLIGPAGTFSVTYTNPEGYVWIGIFQSITVSQSGVIQFIGFVDDELFPKSFVPRLVSHSINWSITIPFGHVIKEITNLAFTNFDIADQWIAVDTMGIYLRSDVWERDSKLMDMAATKYTTPPEVINDK